MKHRFPRQKKFLFRFFLFVFTCIFALLFYWTKGEYHTLFQSHAGGLFFVLLLGLVFSFLFRQLNAGVLSLIVFSFSCLMEFIQLVAPSITFKLIHFRIFTYFFGTAFNPLDFLFYFFGAILVFIFLLFTPGNTKK